MQSNTHTITINMKNGLNTHLQSHFQGHKPQNIEAFYYYYIYIKNTKYLNALYKEFMLGNVRIILIFFPHIW